MKYQSLAWICFLGLLSGETSGQNALPDETPLLRLHEMNVSLDANPASESGLCTVVAGNGDLYIEKRNHLIKDSKGDLKVFEGKLTDSQLDELRSLLANETLKEIADNGANHMPQSATDFGWVTAEIQRGSSIQEIDYRYWSVKSDEYSQAPQLYLTLQKQRQIVLSPLVNWAHAIDVSNLTPTEFRLGMCVRK